MTPERYQQIDQLLLLALEHEPSERSTFLKKACSGDEKLHEEVESLLEFHDRAADFMVEPPSDAAAEVVAENFGRTLPAAGAAARLDAGQALGRYVVRRELGGGGMGVVYAAFDPELDRNVAIKLVRPEAYGNLDGREGSTRLLREAQAMAQLSHPNVIAVFDVGNFGDQVFIAMEYVEGSTLTEWLAEQRRPWRDIVNIFVQAGRGLAAAHAAGILHRDFKPDNVLVGKDGRPRVLDFGLARGQTGKAAERTTDDERATADADSTLDLALLGLPLTAPGRLMGTPAYMAPEQLMGGPADQRTDQYSFCVALYQGLYGELPFKGESMETLIRAMHQRKAPNAPFSHVPSRLRRIVSRGLRPDTAHRYPSMDALLDELVRHTATLRRRSLVLGVLILLAALLAVGRGVWEKQKPVSRRIQSIAVLPLENLTGDAGQEYFVDGMTEALITNLAQFTALRVVSRSSVMHYKTNRKRLHEIATELKVDAVVEGSVTRSGDLVKITAQLIDGSTDRHLWTREYERPFSDIVKLQSELASAIATQLAIQVKPGELARLAAARSVDPEVYNAYLKGRALLSQRYTPSVNRSIEYFKVALQRDPTYAPAYAAMAIAYGYGSSSPNIVLAREATLKALALDDSLAEAHSTMATILFFGEWDWPAAEREYKRAIELDSSDERAFRTYGGYLLCMERRNEARVMFERALQLDPLSSDGYRDLGTWFFFARQYDKAIKLFQRAVEAGPNLIMNHAWLAYAYDFKELHEEAFTEHQRAAALSGNPESPGLARIYARAGRRAEAEKVLDELGVHPPVDGHAVEVAKAYVALNRIDEAIQWLERGYETHDARMTKVNLFPDFDPLHSDPRFQDLLRRMGLPH